MALPARIGRGGLGRPPIVVMAHGFGAQREMRLPDFAERFASRGLAVLVFDYRCFGDSDGEPRNLIDPRRHLEDWHAAIEHVRASPQLDAGRLALWGTSFSGGHVLALGSKVSGISAIVSQVPFVGIDPRGASMPLGKMARALLSGLRDLARAARGASPYYVPIAGPPEEFAFLNTPDAMDAFQDLVPPGSTWQNRAPARVLFQMFRYRPLRDAAKIEAPVLMVAAEDDSLIPVASVEAASKQDPRLRARDPAGDGPLRALHRRGLRARGRARGRIPLQASAGLTRREASAPGSPGPSFVSG